MVQRATTADKNVKVYLNCELTISKLHKIYNNQCGTNLRVKNAMFQRIFVNEFNIGFRSFTSDVTLSEALKMKIKGNNSLQKNEFISSELRHSMI